MLSLLYAWPTVGEVDFVDRHGAPLDLDRCFTPDDDPADVAHFVREAGFLHFRGWAEPELMRRRSPPTWTVCSLTTSRATASHGGHSFAMAAGCACACRSSSSILPGHGGDVDE